MVLLSRLNVISLCALWFFRNRSFHAWAFCDARTSFTTPQTSVPVVVGVNYETAQIKLRDANLKIRVLAKRHDPQFEPGISSLRRLKAASV